MTMEEIHGAKRGDKPGQQQVNRTAVPSPIWPEPIWPSDAALRAHARAREAGYIHF
jgi:hypothetical protein